MNLRFAVLVTACCSAGIAGSVRADCNAGLSSNIDPARYQVNDDGTLTDTTTRLTWQRCPAGYTWSAASPGTCDEVPGEQAVFSWEGALQYAAVSGDGWRLPNTKELESLVKRNCWSPAIEAALFSDLPLGFMWTSTPASAYHGNAWAVQFLDGGVVSVDKSGEYNIRLVKEAQ